MSRWRSAPGAEAVAGGTDPREVAQVKALIAAEIAGFDLDTRGVGDRAWNAKVLAAFEAALIEPEPVEVHLFGGVTDMALGVTRTNGAYRVLWLPWAQVFSLAVESRMGPVDISVHGAAIDCFASV